MKLSPNERYCWCCCLVSCSVLGVDRRARCRPTHGGPIIIWIGLQHDSCNTLRISQLRTAHLTSALAMQSRLLMFLAPRAFRTQCLTLCHTESMLCSCRYASAVTLTLMPAATGAWHAARALAVRWCTLTPSSARPTDEVHHYNANDGLKTPSSPSTCAVCIAACYACQRHLASCHLASWLRRPM
jgi:hypothetical protein